MTSLQRTFESETPDQRKKRLINKRQTHYRKRQKIKYAADTNSINRQDSNNIKHYELGRMDQICVYCGANTNYMVGRAILTPKNTDADIISEMVMDRLPGEIKIYPSVDSTDTTEDTHRQQPQVYSPEFLRSLKISDILLVN